MVASAKDNPRQLDILVERRGRTILLVILLRQCLQARFHICIIDLVFVQDLLNKL